MTLGWLITLAGLAGSLVMFATLNYPAPINAYGSSMELFVFFHAWHLVIALMIGALVLGRLYGGKRAGASTRSSAWATGCGTRRSWPW